MCHLVGSAFLTRLQVPPSQRQDDLAQNSTSLQVSSVLHPDQFGLHLKHPMSYLLQLHCSLSAP